MNYKCRRCSISLDESAYYHSSKGKRSSYCKPCVSAMTNEWAIKNKIRRNEINKEWRTRHSERRKLALSGSNAVYAAIRSGKLIRPDSCSVCGSGGRIEASHHDYSKPLDVTWLCRKCHRSRDAASPVTAGN